MYVRYAKPSRVTHRYPVVMIHGAGQTGTNFAGTPDGRKGWADIFLELGYTVYVVDQAGRGKSAYASDLYGSTTRIPALQAERRWTAPERYNLWPQAHLHTQWPGDGPLKGRIGDSIFDQFYASQVPYIANARLTQQLNRDAGIALLDKIGPAILLTHSQSGPYGWLIADARPQLVRGILAVEPGGAPVVEPKSKNRSNETWGWGLTAIPITYDPPVTDLSQLHLADQASPEGPSLSLGRLQTEPVHGLPNLRNIPILILTSEASEHACYDHCTVNYLTQAGVRVDFVRLPEVGIHGNGHMMMLEKNNREIAVFLSRWAEEHVK
ncbi:MAG: alpha/beta hydrolase [Opitutaceae bacterium]|nr:alpha/beta hydrolase [Opitutaceae bacterium]